MCPKEHDKVRLLKYTDQIIGGKKQRKRGLFIHIIKLHEIQTPLSIEFHWNAARPVCLLSVAASALQQQGWIVATETIGPTKPQIFTIWLFTESFLTSELNFEGHLQIVWWAFYWETASHREGLLQEELFRQKLNQISVRSRYGSGRYGCSQAGVRFLVVW